MAADILLYDANIVPVGKDQKQHIEIARDIAGSFNNEYGDILVMPEGEISEDTAVIPGIDGQKMSKSYGNTINIFDDEKTLKKKIMKIVTESTPVEDPKDPDTCNVFSIYKLFADDNMLSNMKEKYLKGGTGYGQVKNELLELLIEYFRPYRENRKQFENDHGEVYRILKTGADKARAVASITLKRVKDAVGINY
jgi:tryptophanyl-tRNA synthetase